MSSLNMLENLKISLGWIPSKSCYVCFICWFFRHVRICRFQPHFTTYCPGSLANPADPKMERRFCLQRRGSGVESTGEHCIVRTMRCFSLYLPSVRFVLHVPALWVLSLPSHFQVLRTPQFLGAVYSGTKVCLKFGHVLRTLGDLGISGLVRSFFFCRLKAVSVTREKTLKHKGTFEVSQTC